MNNQFLTDMLPQKRLLIIDDEKNMCHMLAALLNKSGYITDTAYNGRQGLKKLDETFYDFILCDLKMPEMDGLDFLKTAGERINTSIVIMMSAYGSTDTALKAIKMGAYDYISKPFKPDEVYLTLKKAEERENLKKENTCHDRQSDKKIYGFGNLITKSRAMKSVFELSFKAASYSTTVLIIGESGTGKELIAKGIHFSGERSKKPFIPVNCGAIPENLIESEFFGYKKGSFTGAEKDKKGLFEEADGGTLFLDEIGDLPLSLQVKLLRVLQENEIRPVGDSKTRKINVRIIAATAKNLDDEIRKGCFRGDLFYRLNVLSIKLPPLRERTEDVLFLSDHFIKKFKKTLNKNISGISPDAVSLLLKYRWPGNVRELENVIESAAVMTEQPVLSIEDFPPVFEHSASDCESDLFEGYSLKTAQKSLEKKLIAKALSATGGNRTEASQLLEISYPSLLGKIKDYNILV